MTIYFDMDGTIADLYGCENWLKDICNENTKPYENAIRLVDIEQTLITIQSNGIRIGIISWLAKDGTNEYGKKVRTAKRLWLEKNFPLIKWDEIHIVKYGTNKNRFCRDLNDILFDDELPNRARWNGKAYDQTQIEIILNNLI